MYEERARVFKALCDARRQQILELLQSGEKCACVLMREMSMPQSSLSYHMKILCDSGIVASREEGKWTHYQISRAGSENALTLQESITGRKQAIWKRCCAGHQTQTNKRRDESSHAFFLKDSAGRQHRSERRSQFITEIRLIILRTIRCSSAKRQVFPQNPEAA